MGLLSTIWIKNSIICTSLAHPHPSVCLLDSQSAYALCHKPFVFLRCNGICCDVGWKLFPLFMTSCNICSVTHHSVTSHWALRTQQFLQVGADLKVRKKPRKTPYVATCLSLFLNHGVGEFILELDQ